MSQLIAIASGKGGVGKTLITAALSVLLQRRGHRVLAADADMGLRNLDLLFGLDGAIHYADDILFVVGPSPSSLRDVSRLMQYCDRQKRFHYDVILNNFYADGLITADTAQSCLQTGHLAGLLPHDEGIDRAAGEGRIASVSESLPFCQALSATADWLETGQAIDTAALTALLPKQLARPVSSGLSLRRRRQECQNWRHYRR